MEGDAEAFRLEAPWPPSFHLPAAPPAWPHSEHQSRRTWTVQSGMARRTGRGQEPPKRLNLLFNRRAERRMGDRAPSGMRRSHP